MLTHPPIRSRIRLHAEPFNPSTFHHMDTVTNSPLEFITVTGDGVTSLTGNGVAPLFHQRHRNPSIPPETTWSSAAVSTLDGDICLVLLQMSAAAECPAPSPEEMSLPLTLLLPHPHPLALSECI